MRGLRSATASPRFGNQPYQHVGKGLSRAVTFPEADVKTLAKLGCMSAPFQRPRLCDNNV